MEDILKSLDRWLKELKQMEEKGIQDREEIGKTRGPFGSEISYDIDVQFGLRRKRRELLKVKRKGNKIFVFGKVPKESKIESAEQEGNKFKILLKTPKGVKEKVLRLGEKIKIGKCKIEDGILKMVLLKS